MMRLPAARWRQALLFLLAASILLLSIGPNLAFLPFENPWAIDLLNLWKFHHCSIRNMPYGPDSTGLLCGDPAGRPMVYPPLLYWSFAWLRLVSFEAAAAIWGAFILAALLTCCLVWLRLAEELRLSSVVLALLLLTQYPALFSVERGNSDIVVVILWTLLAALLATGRAAAAGGAGGLAVMTKVYPVFAIAVTCAAMLRRSARSSFAFALGAGVTAIAAVAILPKTTAAWVEPLRRFAAVGVQPSIVSHAVPALSRDFPRLGSAMSAMLLIAWIAAAPRARSGRQLTILCAGALAISTYFAGTSYDYNLITIYPLLVLLGGAIWRERPNASAIVPFFGLLLTAIGGRPLFARNPELRIELQILALALAALWFTSEAERPESPSSGLTALENDLS